MHQPAGASRRNFSPLLASSGVTSIWVDTPLWCDTVRTNEYDMFYV